MKNNQVAKKSVKFLEDTGQYKVQSFDAWTSLQKEFIGAEIYDLHQEWCRLWGITPPAFDAFIILSESEIYDAGMHRLSSFNHPWYSNFSTATSEMAVIDKNGWSFVDFDVSLINEEENVYSGSYIQRASQLITKALFDTEDFVVRGDGLSATLGREALAAWLAQMATFLNNNDSIELDKKISNCTLDGPLYVGVPLLDSFFYLRILK